MKTVKCPSRRWSSSEIPSEDDQLLLEYFIDIKNKLLYKGANITEIKMDRDIILKGAIPGRSGRVIKEATADSSEIPNDRGGLLGAPSIREQILNSFPQPGRGNTQTRSDEQPLVGQADLPVWLQTILG